MPTKKLTNDQRMLALRLYAEGISAVKIVKELKENHGVSVQLNSIYGTCRAKIHQPRIKEFRDKYLAEVRSVPIANKRIRMDDLERERVRLIKLIEKNKRTTRSDITQYLQLVAELRRISDIAREEMEKKPHMFQNVVIGMGDMSDEALHRRKKELLNRFNASTRGRTSGADTDSGGIESES